MTCIIFIVAMWTLIVIFNNIRWFYLNVCGFFSFNSHNKSSLFSSSKRKFNSEIHFVFSHQERKQCVRFCAVWHCIFVVVSFFFWKLILVKVFDINRQNTKCDERVTNLNKIKFPWTKAINKSLTRRSHIAIVAIVIVIVGQKWKSILRVIYLHASGWAFYYRR